ncbi:MAG: 4a-hydroxytetrahydrobiopterin dehydratase [Betaproteobacteria bacterium]
MSGLSADWLRTQSCRAGSGATRLADAEIDGALQSLPGWTREGEELRKIYRFDDYYRTIAFVNATAWIAHLQDHHPDLDVHYNRCEVAFSTHDAGGITLNDLICAARVDGLGA